MEGEYDRLMDLVKQAQEVCIREGGHHGLFRWLRSTISQAELPWKKKWANTGKEMAPLILLVLLVLLWELLVRLFKVESWLLPAQQP